MTKTTYYLGGDWKFLALVTGIDSATSQTGVPLGEVNVLEYNDMSAEIVVKGTKLQQVNSTSYYYSVNCIFGNFAPSTPSWTDIYAIEPYLEIIKIG